MKLRALLIIPCLMFLAANSLQARESAVLRNGFSISHDHHRQIGSVTRLFLTASEDEYVDMLSVNIVSYEPELDIPSPKIEAIPNPSAHLQPDLQQIVEGDPRLAGDDTLLVVEGEKAV